MSEITFHRSAFTSRGSLIYLEDAQGTSEHRKDADFCLYVHVRIFLERQLNAFQHVIKGLGLGNPVQWLRAE